MVRLVWGWALQASKAALPGRWLVLLVALQAALLGRGLQAVMSARLRCAGLRRAAVAGLPTIC